MAQAPSPGRRAARPGRAWSGWLATGAFVVGLVAGALLVGLLGQDPPVAPTAQQAPATVAAPEDLPTVTADPTDGTRENAACLRAINAAQDIAAVVDDLGAAAAALDAARLDEVVRRLQPLQQRLEQNTADCQVPRSATDEPGPTSPPASPTD